MTTIAEARLAGRSLAAAAVYAIVEERLRSDDITSCRCWALRTATDLPTDGHLRHEALLAFREAGKRFGLTARTVFAIYLALRDRDR